MRVNVSTLRKPSINTILLPKILIQKEKGYAVAVC